MAHKSSTIAGPGRVDTHHHFIPSSMPELMMDPQPGVNTAAFPRTPQEHLSFMDEHGIQTAVLSANIHGHFTELSSGQLLDLCGRTWQAHQDYIKLNPLRFGSFAMLPFPFVAETLEFIESSAKGSIVPDGYTVATSLGGLYITDQVFEPVWTTLDKLHATVFVHPIDTTVPANLKIPPFVLEYTFDTARCVLSVILSGMITRYPNINFIFSHNGGVYPYIAHRAMPLEHLVRANNKNKSTYDILSTGNIYFDTAIAYKTQFPLTKDLGLPVEHILYGSDYPYSAFLDMKAFMLGSESPAQSGVFSDDDSNAKIARENALNLFPRLKKLYQEEFKSYYKDR